MIFKHDLRKRSDFLLTKLETICSTDDLRPAMQCVYFKNGFVYATDGLVAVKQHLHIHGIDEEVAKHLDGQMLHKDHLKLMKKCDYFEIVKGGIKSKKGIIEMIHLFVTEERYPDVEAVIPKSGFSEIDGITLNASIMKRLQDVMLMALDNTYKYVRLKFRDKNKAILITTNIPEEDQIAIMMPVHGKD